MSSFEIMTTYVKWLAQINTNLSFDDVFVGVHLEFYNDVDISMKPLFDDISKYNGQFVIPHTLLFDCGVIEDNTADTAMELFEYCGMIEYSDYRVSSLTDGTNSLTNNAIDTDMMDIEDLPSKNHQSVIFILTPEIFTRCVVIAPVFEGQKIYPNVYGSYFMLCDTVSKLYDIYNTEVMEIKLSSLMLSSTTL